MGRELYAIGSNPDAAVLAGIRVSRRVLGAFVASGRDRRPRRACSTPSRYGTLDAAAGTGIELAAVVRGRRRRRRDLRRRRHRLRRRARRAAAGHDPLLAGDRCRSTRSGSRPINGALLLLAIGLDALPRPRDWPANCARGARTVSERNAAVEASRARVRPQAPRALGDRHRLPAALRDPLRHVARRRTSCPAATSTRSSPTSSEIALIALPLTLVIVAAEIDLVGRLGARPHQRPDGLPVEPRLGDGDDHPDGHRRRGAGGRAQRRAGHPARAPVARRDDRHARACTAGSRT